MSDNTSLKGQGKGAFMKNQWAHMADNQIAPSTDDIRKILNPKREFQYLYLMPIEELENRITNYFQKITYPSIDPDTGEQIIKYKTPPSIYELSLAVGFDRETLIDYSNGEWTGNGTRGAYKGDASAHSAVIKKSLEIIRSFYEKKLSGNGNPAGSCFWLKNSTNGAWKDEHTFTVKPQDPMGNIQSPEDLDKLTLPPSADEE